jgi:transposase
MSGMSHPYRTQDIGHCGLVAGMFDELNLVSLIDSSIKQDFKQRTVTVGQSIKALVLNGLGFTARRLYLTPEFFRDKPTDILIGAGIEPDHLNDDVLGRALDTVFDFGASKLFSILASHAVFSLGIQPKIAHNDTTSFHVDGEYNSNAPESEVEDQGIVRITQGYSRDKRQDLNQIVLELIVENQAGLPIFMQAISGNQVDTQTLKESIEVCTDQLKNMGVSCTVRDAAGYTTDSLTAFQAVGQKWIMRVPHTIKDVKFALENCKLENLQSYAPGYLYQAINVTYAGVPQRWMLIYPINSREREHETQSKKLLTATNKETKKWNKLCKQEFKSPEDALKALEEFNKSLKTCEVASSEVFEVKRFGTKGRPAANAIPKKIVYFLKGSINPLNVELDAIVDREVMFVLATNELDESAMTDLDILNHYKSQNKVERGFKFLKDPSFQANTIFIKTPERVEALMMVMTLSLLVYAAIQYRIRQELDKNNASIPDQKRKPTKNPTAKWVFELFQGVHLLSVLKDDAVQTVLTMNLRPELRALLGLLGARFQVLYP